MMQDALAPPTPAFPGSRAKAIFFLVQMHPNLGVKSPGERTKEMKTYLVFVDGVEVPGLIIRAKNHNSAERKAQKRFPNHPPHKVWVAYTEI